MHVAQAQAQAAMARKDKRVHICWPVEKDEHMPALARVWTHKDQPAPEPYLDQSTRRLYK